MSRHPSGHPPSTAIFTVEKQEKQSAFPSQPNFSHRVRTRDCQRHSACSTGSHTGGLNSLSLVSHHITYLRQAHTKLAVMNPQRSSHRKVKEGKKTHTPGSQISMLDLETHILANLFQRTHDNVQALQKQVSVQVLGAQGRLMEDERTCATVAPKCCGNVANQTVSVLANHANSWRT